MQTIQLKKVKSLAVLAGAGLFLCNSYAGYPSPVYKGPATPPNLSMFPAFGVSVDATAPAAGTPEIAEWTRINQPGDTMVLTGSGYEQGMGFEVYGEGVGIVGANVDQLKGMQAVVKLPTELPARQMYLVWPKNNAGYGRPVAVNQTDAWWIGPTKPMLGKSFSVYGRNLQLGNSAAHLYIAEADRWLTATSANSYKADFVFPGDLDARSYTVFLHNGSGGQYGWSSPLTVDVVASPAWSATTINVKDYGAKGDGVTDDHNAIVSAFNACPSYGTIYFPAGTYALGSKIKMGLTNKRLLGDGPNSSTITTTSSYSESTSYGMFHVDLTNVEVDGLGFESGAYNVGIGVRCTGSKDTTWTNCRFSDLGSPSMKNNIEVQNGRNLTFSDCEFITWKGTYMAGCNGLFITNCLFEGRGDVEAGYLVSISGADHVSIVDSVAKHYDNSDYTDGEGWCQGRFVLMDGNFGTCRQIYIGGNTTIDMAPRYNFDIGWYSGQPHQNAGEQILAEHQRTKFRGAVSSATASTVRCSSLANDYAGQMITIVDGRGFGQSRLIASVDAAAGTVTVTEPWNVIPDSTSTVAIGLYINRIIVYGNRFDGPRHVSLPINTDNNTPPYDTNSHPRQTASTAVSFYGGCSESIVASNIITEVGSGICDWSVMDDSDVSNAGVSIAQPNYFNLFENNIIDRCQNLFKNVAFNTAGDPIQGDIAIFNATWRNNIYNHVADSQAVAEYTSYPEVSIELSVYENNVQSENIVMVEPPPPDGPPDPVLSGIAISGSTDIDEETATQYTCTASYSDGSSKTVTPTWSENSSFASISSTGLLSAGNVTSDQSVTITASFGGKTATHAVTINYVPPTLLSIAISGPSIVNEETTAQYTCTASWSDGSSTTVIPTWSENSAYATISSSGLLGAAKVTSDQSVTITASFGGKTDAHAVTINYVAPSLTGITISGPSSLDEETAAQYTCTASYSDGTSSVVAPGWSENSAYATISGSGLLSAGNVTSDQGVTITASFGGKTDTHMLTINYVAPTLTGITISGPSSLDEETAAQYTCTASYSDGTSSVVTPGWNENSGYASISASGVLTAGNVASDQSVTLTATYDGKADTHSVTILYVVPPVVVTGISISGATELNENSTATFICTASYSDGTFAEVQPDWSDDAAFASIDSSGVLVCGNIEADDVVRVSATLDGHSDTQVVSALMVPTQVIYPLSGFAGKTVWARLWDESAQEWHDLGEMVDPSELVIDNVNPDQWYWISIKEFDDATSSWVTVHSSWLNM